MREACENAPRGRTSSVWMHHKVWMQHSGYDSFGHSAGGSSNVSDTWGRRWAVTRVTHATATLGHAWVNIIIPHSYTQLVLILIEADTEGASARTATSGDRHTQIWQCWTDA
jgi:hypothetical protein